MAWNTFSMERGWDGMLEAFLCKTKKKKKKKKKKERKKRNKKKKKWSLCVVHYHLRYIWESNRKDIFLIPYWFWCCYHCIGAAIDCGMLGAVGCPNLLSKL